MLGDEMIDSVCNLLAGIQLGNPDPPTAPRDSLPSRSYLSSRSLSRSPFSGSRLFSRDSGSAPQTPRYSTDDEKMSAFEEAREEGKEFSQRKSGDESDFDVSMEITSNPENSPPQSPLPPERKYSESGDDEPSPSKTVENSDSLIDEETAQEMQSKVISLLKGSSPPSPLSRYFGLILLFSSFDKTEIAIHGCKTKGITVIDDILVSLSRLESKGLSRFNIQSLQRAILKEALDFFYARFNMEAVSSSDSMVNAFVTLCVLSIEFILWAEPSLHAIENSSTKDSEFRFIQFVFQILKGIFTKSSGEGGSKVVDFMPFLAAQVAIQSQMVCS